MKRLILLFIGCISLILSSCNENEDVLFFDVQNNSTLSTKQGTIDKNETFQFKVLLQNKTVIDESLLKYYISYKLIGTDPIASNPKAGEMSINKSVIDVGEKFEHSLSTMGDELLMEFTPFFKYEYVIEITVDNGHKVVVHKLDLTSSETIIIITDDAPDIEVNKPTIFKLYLDEQTLTRGGDSDEEYPTKYTFSKNKGSIKNITNFADNSKSINDTIPNDSKSINSTTFSNNDLILLPGMNELEIVTEEIGSTQIDLEINTSRGTKRHSVVFNSLDPSEASLNITIRQTSLEEMLTLPYSFTAEVTNTSPNDIFEISYRWIKTGYIQEPVTINSKEMIAGDKVEAKSGIQTFHTTPNSIGERELEIIFTDQYGKKIIENVSWTVTKNAFSIRLDDILETGVSVNKQVSHFFDISYVGEATTISCQYRLLGDSEIKNDISINNGNFTANEKIDVPLGRNIISFTPTAPRKEIFQIEFTFNDSFNQSIIDTLNIFVNPPKIDVKLTLPASNMIIYDDMGIRLVFNTDEPSSSVTDYWCKVELISMDNSGTPRADLKFTTPNGDEKNVRANVSFDIKPGIADIVFTPKTYGKVEIKVTIGDQYGAFEDESVFLTVGNLINTLDVGSIETSFSHVGYENELLIDLIANNDIEPKILISSLGVGIKDLMINSKPARLDENIPVSSGFVKISYKAISPGDSQLLVSFTDKYGNNTNQTPNLKKKLTFINEYKYKGIDYSLTNTGTASVSSKYNFYIDLNDDLDDRDEYTIQYDYNNWDEPSILSVNGGSLIIGSDFSVDSKGLLTFSYTAHENTVGQHILRFTLSNKMGSQEKIEVRINVLPINITTIKLNSVKINRVSASQGGIRVAEVELHKMYLRVQYKNNTSKVYGDANLGMFYIKDKDSEKHIVKTLMSKIELEHDKVSYIQFFYEANFAGRNTSDKTWHKKFGDNCTFVFSNGAWAQVKGTQPRYTSFNFAFQRHQGNNEPRFSSTVYFNLEFITSQKR